MNIFSEFCYLFLHAVITQTPPIYTIPYVCTVVMSNPPWLHYFKVMNSPTPSLLKCPELPDAFTMVMDSTLLNIRTNKPFLKFFVMNFVTTVRNVSYKHYLLCNTVNGSNYLSGCTIVKMSTF